MAKRNRQAKWFKDGEKFVGITHEAIDYLNKHDKRRSAYHVKTGEKPGEVTLEARWLLITMAKKWNRKRPEEAFQYPIRILANEIGWSCSKVIKCINELKETGILVTRTEGKERKTRTWYNFDKSFMGVPTTGDQKPKTPNPVKKLV